ncbi:MAG: DUF87 domain-containing protein [Actinomycetota bacterium]|nr:DUF87 domain-containing protein [Actinomycetota bacterium]
MTAEPTDPRILDALRRADFGWTVQLARVWSDDGSQDVPAIHQRVRGHVLDELWAVDQSVELESPPGTVIRGAAGSGKTHLLGALRRDVWARGHGFVLVDLTDIREFWPTTLQGYLTSLQQPLDDPQIHAVIDTLFDIAKVPFDRKDLATAGAGDHVRMTKELLGRLAHFDRPRVLRNRDALRALLLLDSDDFDLSAAAQSWFEGIDLEHERDQLGFATASAADPSAAVGALSWVMALRGPTLLALDQLDAIVAQHHLARDPDLTDDAWSGPSEEHQRSAAIIHGLGGGLMGLHDRTCRTVVVVSCLNETWSILEQQMVASVAGRFAQPLTIDSIPPARARDVVAARLAPAYRAAGVTPPYPTFPFADAFFEAAQHPMTRKLLRVCAEYRDHVVATTEVREAIDFPPRIPRNGDEKPTDWPPFEAARQRVDVDALRDPSNVDRLAELVRNAAQCLVEEQELPDDVDGSVDTEFPGGAKAQPLDCRVRVAFRAEQDREHHLCVRVLQHTHPNAYKARLRAATTASGIDRDLSFRRLVLVRTTPVPGGAQTRKMHERFLADGGILAEPTDDDLRTLGALGELFTDPDPELMAWLRTARPASGLTFFAAQVPDLFGPQDAHTTALRDRPDPGDQTTGRTEGTPGWPAPPKVADATEMDDVGPPDETTFHPHPIRPAVTPDGSFPLGRRLEPGRPVGSGDPVTVPVADLRRHTVVFAGSGSGKTVLLRRLIEEAALTGLPSIVVDGANDLARLGDRWEETPAGWFAGDAERAERYHRDVEVVVWTPGGSGNPLTLDPLPDLAAVSHDRDELDAAADMARDALVDIVARGTSQKSENKKGVLKAALLYFGKQLGGGQLPELITLLSDLPPEAGLGISKEETLAAEMADSLRAAMVNNRLLRPGGTPLDPATLLGLGEQRTRVSVVNLAALGNLENQQQFVNQLAMTLFTWIKKNPAPADQELRGLFVIDEAKDMVPSVRATPAKTSLLRLTAQARKYGLGILFATQEPRSIDNQVTTNCLTQFVGRFSSPTTIGAAKELLQAQQTSGDDVGRLDRGQFYVWSEQLRPAVKVAVPRCLSADPGAPLDESEVESRARRDRAG